MISPDPDPASAGSSRVALKQFAAAAGEEAARGSVRAAGPRVASSRPIPTGLAGCSRHRHRGRRSGGSWSRWRQGGRRGPARGVSLKRFFVFLTPPGSAMSASMACSRVPRRGGCGRCRASPVRRTTVSSRGSIPDSLREEGLRDGRAGGLDRAALLDIVALRLDQIDWRRDEIRLVQAKTSRALVLPLPALAATPSRSGSCTARRIAPPEVFVRLQARS